LQNQLDEAIHQQRDSLQTLQVQVIQLRSHLVNLQSDHEMLKEDFHRLQQENQTLTHQIADEIEINASSTAGGLGKENGGSSVRRISSEVR
jgi:regulator of replication initiation timing